MGCGRDCKFSACSCLGVVISIVFGAIIGVLFAFDLIPFITTVIWIAFGIGAFGLVFLLLALIVGAVTGRNALTKCLCDNTSCLLAASIGTILSSIIALSFVLDVASIFAAAVVAIVAFFFALLIIALIAFVSCVICKTCSRAQE